MWTRRALLRKGGLAAIAAGMGGASLVAAPGAGALGAGSTPPFRAGPAARRRVLVTLFQRGAMDGLMAVGPLAGGCLRRLRPGLAMSGAHRAGERALLDLDGAFGLHPALAPLLPHWREGRLAVVHAVGSPDPTRSHFQARESMESGTPFGRRAASGWLDRLAGLLGPEESPLRAVALAPALPRSLRGRHGALALARRSDLAPLVRRLTASGRLPRPAAVYPDSSLGRALRRIAILVKADVGLRIAFAESGGWDTHVEQGTVAGGFALRAADLAASLAAFWSDLGARREDVVVMTATEFGRALAENASGGTEHGRGSCLFVLGERVEGGTVHADLSGARPEDLLDGPDLPVTTDFRAVFSAVARGHLGVRDEGTLFPGWSGRPLPLIHAA